MQAPIETVHPPREAEANRGRSHRWVLLLAAGPVAIAILRLVPDLDRTLLDSPAAHALISASGASLGVALALLVVQAGLRSRDARAFLIGLGLLSIAAVFALHALATPGVFLSGPAAAQWSAQLSLLVGGAFLALSGVNLRVQTGGWVMRRPRLWLGLLIAGWGGLAWLTFAPAALGTAEAHHGGAGGPAAIAGLGEVLSLAGIACYTFAAWRHARLYRETPTRAGLAITCGIVLFGQALAVQALHRGAYSASFWLYHALEFAGFGVISAAILADRRAGQTDEAALEALFLRSTRSRLQSSYSRALEALVETLSRGEQPTPAQRRELHIRLGLAESQLRALEGAAAAVAQERRQRRELEQLNAQLRQLERDKVQLTQMVVHDLKNPLTALIGFVEILRMDAERLSPHQQALLDGAIRSGRSLSGLIGDLLDAARLEESRLDLVYTPFALGELLRECVEELGAWLDQEEKQARIEMPDGPVLLVADRRLLRRVVINLLSNAIKHTPAGTHITMRARALAAGEGPQHAVIEVEDNGPGIPPEFLSKIFDKFSRLAPEGHGRQQSTGLGLSFCRLAVEAHGGALDVRSTLGEGTIFRATLPISPPEEFAAAA